MTAEPLDWHQDFYDNAPCGFIILDEDGAIVDANQTLLRWLGTTTAELAGTPFVGLLPPPDQLFYETRFAPVLQLHGEAKEIALALLTTSGRLPVLVNATLVPASADWPAHTRMAIFDATERQDYERQLLAARRAAESSESRVRTLQAASSALGDADTEQHVAELLVGIARDAMAASACAVLLVDAEGVTTLIAGEHPLRAVAADPARAPELAALREAGTVAVGSLEEALAVYPGLVDGLTAAGVEAFSIVPILGQDRHLGALMCFFGRPRDLSGEDLDLQTALARQTAQVLTRMRLQEELLALALHDHLTGLANRRLLREHLTVGLAAARRNGTPISMVVIDLDGFKAINDERGHQEGDAVLKWVADQIVGSVRSDDLVGRFGGDEFMVICHETAEDAAVQIAERIREAVATYPVVLEGGIPLTASVGLAVHAPGTRQLRPEEMFASADAAMYASKRDGKNRITTVSV